MKKIIIHIYQNNLSIIYKIKYSSILNALELNKIQVEFQCRSGYCGICRLRLLSGKIKYFYNPIALIRLGEILPCCCLPINNIEIEL